jgi:competence protein ComEC
VIDREKLKETGAVTLAFGNDGAVEMQAARAPDEDRPWSPAPKRGWGRAEPIKAAQDRHFQDEETEPGDESPLE